MKLNKSVCVKCGSNKVNLQNACNDVYKICQVCKHQELVGVITNGEVEYNNIKEVIKNEGNS